VRELTGHRVNPVNDKLKIEVLDEPGAGGANHLYRVRGAELSRNQARNSVGEIEPNDTFVLFQNGPINENGINGVTQEVLLEIVADRLRSFQAGKFACRENAVALTHIETAQLWLQKRTLERMQRGVEGTNQK
jgi:hypothetical protein